MSRPKRETKPPSVKRFEKQCEMCTRSFKTFVRAARFCSKECRAEYSVIPPEEKPITGKLRLRFEALKKCKFRCFYCGRSPRNHNITLEVDHIIPRSKGGSDELTNLVAACYECNMGKSDRLIEGMPA